MFGVRGTHIIAELSQCKHIAAYDDVNEIQKLLRYAAMVGKATVLQTSAKKFEPQGVSGYAFLEESHISIHASPEVNYAAVDVYTCGDNANTHAILEYLRGALGAEKSCETVLFRGIRLTDEAGQYFVHES